VPDLAANLRNQDRDATLQLAQTASDITSIKRIDRPALAHQLRVLSKVSPLRSLAAVVVQWCVILGAAAPAVTYGHWYLYAMAVAVIATRQHALGVLFHEGSHYRLFRSRLANDAFSDLCCALPLGVSTSVYRHRHFGHHRQVNTDQDPDIQMAVGDADWVWPKSKIGLLSVFLRDLFGLNFPMIVRFIRLWSPYPLLLLPSQPNPSNQPRLAWYEKWLVVTWTGALIACLILVPNAWWYFLVLWLLPQMTVLTVIVRVRALAEHYCLAAEDELTHTRTVKANWIERFLFSPCNVNYHLEHHLFPSVPFFNLPKLHRLLMASEAYRFRACVTSGYLVGRNSLLVQLLRSG
jgi:fatty acid desaturase